jgi:predicted alpha/beta superfamily hydrolase
MSAKAGPTMRYTGALLLALMSLVPAGLREAMATSPPVPEVRLHGTQLRELHSRIVGQDYRLMISLPAGYTEGDESYPVLLVLDAQWDFPLLYAIYGQQYYDGMLPGLILVGITWGGQDPDPDVLRLRDFTPSDPSGTGASGGAEKFLAFIERELIPYLGRNYRTNNHRTLVGSSLGGLFTLYALFERPDLFANFIPTSPATIWDDNALYAHAAEFAERSTRHPSRLFIAVAELEDLYEPVQEFAEFLRQQDYPGLSWASHVVTGSGHSGVKPEGNTRGLQYVFKRPDLTLTTEQLAPLTGRYRADDEDTLVVFHQADGRLVASVPATGEQKTLSAESPGRFYTPGEFLTAIFEHDGGGAVTGFTLHTFGNTRHFTRLASD